METIHSNQPPYLAPYLCLPFHHSLDDTSTFLTHPYSGQRNTTHSSTACGRLTQASTPNKINITTFITSRLSLTMADEPTDTNPQPQAAGRRRSSLAGQTLADLFGNGNGNRQQQQRPAEASLQTPQSQGPITAAAQQANQRRLSLTTLGLSGSPSQTSPFGSYRTGRRESISSANSSSVDESAIAEDDVSGQKDSNPTTPFARRMSFGAKALRDVRGGGNSGSSNGRSNPVNGSGHASVAPPPPPPSSLSNHKGRTPSYSGAISSRDVKGRGLSCHLPLPFPYPQIPTDTSPSNTRPNPHSNIRANNETAQKLITANYVGSVTSPAATNEGFNWSENFRTRAERSSISAGSGQQSLHHTRAKSVASSGVEPPKEMPKAPVAPPAEKPKPALQQRPDHFQERILKGDFYMD